MSECYEMSEAETEVIQAAIDFDDMNRALDCGCPTQQQIAKARQAILDRVANLHGEHDGRYAKQFGYRPNIVRS